MSFAKNFLDVCDISYPKCNSVTIHWIILKTQAFSISLHPYKGTVLSITYHNKQKNNHDSILTNEDKLNKNPSWKLEVIVAF